MYLKKLFLETPSQRDRPRSTPTQTHNTRSSGLGGEEGGHQKRDQRQTHTSVRMDTPTHTWRWAPWPETDKQIPFLRHKLTPQARVHMYAHTCTHAPLETDGNRPRSYDIAARNHYPKQHTQRDTWPALSEADTLRCTNTHPWRETLTRRRADGNNCARRNRHSHADTHEEPRRHSQRCTPPKLSRNPAAFSRSSSDKYLLRVPLCQAFPLDVGDTVVNKTQSPPLKTHPEEGKLRPPGKMPGWKSSP